METSAKASRGARRRRAGGERRRAVLDAAVRVIAERGYERTRFVDVSEASGVAVSTLQYYFGSREDMIVEAFRYATEEDTDHLKREDPEETAPWERLIGMVDRTLFPSEDQEAAPDLWWRVLLEFWRAATRDPELRETSVELYERYRAPFLEAIEEGTRTGVFRPRRSPQEIVTQLIAALDGVAVPVLLDHPYLDLEALREAIVGGLADALDVTGR